MNPSSSICILHDLKLGLSSNIRLSPSHCIWGTFWGNTPCTICIADLHSLCANQKNFCQPFLPISIEHSWKCNIGINFLFQDALNLAAPQRLESRFGGFMAMISLRPSKRQTLMPAPYRLLDWIRIWSILPSGSDFKAYQHLTNLLYTSICPIIGQESHEDVTQICSWCHLKFLAEVRSCHVLNDVGWHTSPPLVQQAIDLQKKLVKECSQPQFLRGRKLYMQLSSRLSTTQAFWLPMHYLSCKTLQSGSAATIIDCHSVYNCLL